MENDVFCEKCKNYHRFHNEEDPRTCAQKRKDDFPRQWIRGLEKFKFIPISAEQIPKIEEMDYFEHCSLYPLSIDAHENELGMNKWKKERCLVV